MKFKYYEELMTIGYMANVMDQEVNFHQILLLNFLMIYNKFIVILKHKKEIYLSKWLIKYFFKFYIHTIIEIV